MGLKVIVCTHGSLDTILSKVEKCFCTSILHNFVSYLKCHMSVEKSIKGCLQS